MQCSANELIVYYTEPESVVVRHMRVPIVRQLQQKGSSTEVLLVKICGREYVVKFTSDRDVKMHRQLTVNPLTRHHVVSLLSVIPLGIRADGTTSAARVLEVSGSNALRRRPWKLMEFINHTPPTVGKRKLTRSAAVSAFTEFSAVVVAEMVRCVLAVYPELRDEDDWRSPKNILWSATAEGLMRPMVFDFD